MIAESHRFPKFLKHNLGLKILSLLLAVIAWYAIKEAISFETIVTDVPIRIIADEGWAVLDRSSETADVVFRGSQEDVLQLRREYIEIVVDVRGRRAGTLHVDLGPADVKAPAGVKAVYVRPQSLVLTLDREFQKHVPVQANLQGKPPEGYVLESASCEPPTVTISGPKQQVARIEAVRTAPIDMEGRLRSFQVRVPVVIPRGSWIARVDPQRVLVRVQMSEHAEQRVISNLLVRALVDPDQESAVDIRPGSVEVALEGRPDILAGLDTSDIHAYVDCVGLKPGTKRKMPVAVYLPENLRLVGISPRQVSVRIGR